MGGKKVKGSNLLAMILSDCLIDCLATYLLHFIKSLTGPSFPTSNLFAGQMVTGNSGSVIAVAGNNAVLELSEGSTQWNKLKVSISKFS